MQETYRIVGCQQVHGAHKSRWWMMMTGSGGRQTVCVFQSCVRLDFLGVVDIMILDSVCLKSVTSET